MGSRTDLRRPHELHYRRQWVEQGCSRLRGIFITEHVNFSYGINGLQNIFYSVACTNVRDFLLVSESLFGRCFQVTHWQELLDRRYGFIFSRNLALNATHGILRIASVPIVAFSASHQSSAA